MDALCVKHEPVVVTPYDATLFKRELGQGVVVKSGVILTELEHLREQHRILLKIGEGKDTSGTLLGYNVTGLLKP